MKWFGIPLLTAAGLWLLATPADGQDKKLTDEDISKQLVGKWVQEPPAGLPKGISVKLDLTANKDGTFAITTNIEIEKDDMKKSVTGGFSGTWKVADGKIELTIKKTEGNGPKPKEGSVEKLTVIDINETTLKTMPEKKGAKTQESIFKRAKD